MYTPKNIKALLDMAVVGQESAKIDLSVVVYNHQLRFYRNVMNPMLPCPPKLNMMIVGPTGSGKSLLIKTLLDYIQLPYLMLDANSITAAGGTQSHGDIRNRLLDCCLLYTSDAADERSSVDL